jgi:hypothetical protein
MKNQIKKSLFTTITKPLWMIDEENTISYKLLKEFSIAFYYLPKSLRKRVFPIIQILVILLPRFFLVLNQNFLQGYILNGIEKHSGKNLKILFISNTTPSPYILHLIYTNKPKIERNVKFNIINIKKYVSKIQSDIDAVFIKCDRFYSGFFEKQGYKIIPEWIRMIIDISEPLESFFNTLSKNAKEEIRRIKKLDYTYEVSQDLEKLKLFYYNMYIPYTAWRYPETDIHTNFYIMKHLLDQGSKILFIKYKDEYIFGGFFLKKKNFVTASYAGVMKGKFDHVKRGVIAASYYYLIIYSKLINAKIIDLGSCRPFVNDGLFNYKKKWSTKISKSEKVFSEIYSFKKCSNKEGIKSFLINNPFIYLEKNKLNTEAYKKSNKDK